MTEPRFLVELVDGQETLKLLPTPTPLSDLATEISRWAAAKGFVTEWSNVPEKLMLVVTELAEAMEEYRYIGANSLDVLDGKIPLAVNDEDLERVRAFEVEIADTFIRLFDLAGGLGINLDRVVAEKMAINQGRPFRHGKER